MPTRLYFSGAQAAPITNVNPDAAWEYQSEFVRRKLLTAKEAGEALALGTQIGPWTAGQDALDRQFVSPPLSGSHVFLATDTIRCQIACREFATSDNTTSRLGMRIVSGDGTTVRGTLRAVANYGPTTELINNASLRNKAFADADTVSAVTALDGDRIVVEIGYSDAAGSTPEGQARWGAPTGTNDHAQNETETTSLVPWVEFSNTLTFGSDLSAVGRSLQGVWDDRATVGLSRQGVWNVRETAGLSRQAFWNVGQVVGRAIDARWNVRALTSNTLQAIYAVAVSAGRSLQAVWDQRAAAGRSLAAAWNVAALALNAPSVIYTNPPHRPRVQVF